MLEYPECRVAARQLAQRVQGHTIVSTQAGKTPHRFAFFAAPPDTYSGLLNARRVDCVDAFGCYVQLAMGNVTLLLGDGVGMRWYAPGEALPDKHQLLLHFEDGGALVCRVGTYGGMWAQQGVSLEENHRAAVQRPGILDSLFTLEYFTGLLAGAAPASSLQEALATQRHIPGLAGGVLQEVLFDAQLHPMRGVGCLGAKHVDALFFSLKSTVQRMEEAGGRDTELDVFGNAGGYKTRMSRFTLGRPCPRCGQPVEKAPYLGGTVYFCPGCQPV